MNWYLTSEKEPAAGKLRGKTEHVTSTKSQENKDTLNASGRERRAACLKHGRKGGGGIEDLGQIR